jgi:hypothetical protein
MLAVFVFVRRTLQPAIERCAALPVGARGLLPGAACALVLAGCAGLCDELIEGADAFNARTDLALADTFQDAAHRALLVPPSKPECEMAASGQRLAPQGEVDADLALRIKLEYERECYRRAEARVRRQLRALQAAVKENVEAPNGAANARR